MPRVKGSDVRPQERAVTDAYLKNGGSVTGVSQQLGIQASDVSRTLNRPRVRKHIRKLMDQRGLTEMHLLKVLKEGLEANKVISAVVVKGKGSSDVHEIQADDGSNDFIEVPDHATRHKFLETALKLRGYLKNGDVVEGNKFVSIIYGHNVALQVKLSEPAPAEVNGSI